MPNIDRRKVTQAMVAGAAAGGAGLLEGVARAGGATPASMGRFDVAKIAATFPETSETMLVDQYLSDRPSASARIFRIYRPIPPHFHTQCDEFLYVYAGRGTFWMGDAASEAEFGPGQLLLFDRGTVHALPKIIEGPVIFLSVDTPRRDPKDITFVNPSDGTAEGFVKQKPASDY